MAAPDIGKTLGYGGSAEVDGVQVLVTSGSFSSAFATSWLQMIQTLPDGTPANKVLHADGTTVHSGSVGFDVSKDAMQLFAKTRLLRRFYPFDVGVFDGNDQYKMANCKATSVSLTGAAGGLVSATVAFLAPATWAPDTVLRAFIRDPTAASGQAVGYWWSGAKATLKAKSWTFTMNQDVTPVYGNTAGADPLYLRVGLTEYSLDVESYNALAAGSSDTVYIATDSFTLAGTTSETGFQFNGVTDLGTYRYLFGSGVTVGDAAQPVVS